MFYVRESKLKALLEWRRRRIKRRQYFNGHKRKQEKRQDTNRGRKMQNKGEK